MLASKKRVIQLCDKLMQINPSQILIDLVEDEIEDRVYSDDVTPDEIGALEYQCSILRDVYNPEFTKDITYLIELEHALLDWGADATFANKTLGLDPNK